VLAFEVQVVCSKCGVRLGDSILVPIDVPVEAVVLLFEVVAVEAVDNAGLCDPGVVGVEVIGFVVFIKCGVKVDEVVPGTVGVVDTELLVCIKYGVESDV